MDVRRLLPMLVLLLLVASLILGVGQVLAAERAATSAPTDVAAAATPATPAEKADAAPAEKPAAAAPAEKPDAAPAEDADASPEAQQASTQAQIDALAATTRGNPFLRLRSTTPEQRREAARRNAKRRGAKATAGRTAPAGSPSRAASVYGAPGSASPNGARFANIFEAPNWANSPPLMKFQDSLPGVGLPGCTLGTPGAANSCNENNLGNFIPVAQADTTTFPGSDYYTIGVSDYTTWKFHSAMPATRLRGYMDLNAAGAAVGGHYMGPLILATRDRPVRLLLKNLLPLQGAVGPTDTTAARSFIPVDYTYMGGLTGPGGTVYTENRAVIHLHGGNDPWISDGTQHQWITPANQQSTVANAVLKGLSFRNVPDMVGPGKPIPSPSASDGMGTYYYTNQQSARLLFYHDHVQSQTRTNVYMGEAAGYLIHDSVVDGLVNTGILPNNGGGAYQYGIPLIIQDKSFVNASTAVVSNPLLAVDPLASPTSMTVPATTYTDPTWADQASVWGQTAGSLWLNHVYTTNQDPYNPEGANQYGRWDYGMWFWPPLSATELAHPGTACSNYGLTGASYPAGSICPDIPNPSGTPESFMDTPIVNGQAYPYLTLPQGAYRFQILSVANDRFLNLQLYYAVDLATYMPAAFAPTGALVTAPTGVCNGAGPAPDVAGGPRPDKCAEVAMVPAFPHSARPALTGTPNQYQNMMLCGSPLALTPTSATLSAEAGLAYVPIDSTTATGFPATVDPKTGLSPNCWPTNWPTDGREGGVPDPMLAGPPIVQIGTESGILPHPVVIPSTPVGYNYNRRDIVVLNVNSHDIQLGPAERADVVIDFSQVPAGSTLILYNDNPAPIPAFDTRFDYYTYDEDQSGMNDAANDTGGSDTTLPGYGPNTRTIMQFRIVSGSAAAYSVKNLDAALPAAFAQDQNAPIVPEPAFNAAYGATYPDVAVRIQDPAITFTPQGGASTISPVLLRKAIHELFEQNYGRMNAVLGVEASFASFTTQTTIPYASFDPPTEVLQDGQPQYWKITHNGVDTHSMHFHLYDVQVINRVGWDGAVRRPDPNEVGWKDTVRMNPLEDVVVAMRPSKQNLPWPIPDSVRVLDVNQPEGSLNAGLGTGFTKVDVNNNGYVLTNQKINFGWEYLWHCHILGHEENDMMRTQVFQVAPEAPTGLSATQTGAGQVTLNWIDHSAAETGFRVQYSTDPTFATGVTTVPTVPNTTLITGPAGAPTTQNITGLAPGNTYNFRVASVKDNVYSFGAGGIQPTPTPDPSLPLTWSAYTNVASVGVVLGAPVITSTNATGTSPAISVTVNWSAVTGATSYVLERATAIGGPYTQIGTATTSTSRTQTGVSAGNYYYRVGANPGPVYSTPVNVGPPAAPSLPATGVPLALSGTTGITFRWTDNSPATSNPPNYNVETSWAVSCTGAATKNITIAASSGTGTRTNTNNTFTVPGSYTCTITAMGRLGNSTALTLGTIVR